MSDENLRKELEKLARICDKRGYRGSHKLFFMAHVDADGKLTATLTVGDVRALLAADTEGPGLRYELECMADGWEALEEDYLGKIAIKELRAALAALPAPAASTEGLREALEEYGSHKYPCLLAQWHEGRPTSDGGYETRYGDRWYRGDDKPPCICGFDAALRGEEGKYE